jgi:hypothetical protein
MSIDVLGATYRGVLLCQDLKLTTFKTPNLSGYVWRWAGLIRSGHLYDDLPEDVTILDSRNTSHSRLTIDCLSPLVEEGDQKTAGCPTRFRDPSNAKAECGWIILGHCFCTHWPPVWPTCYRCCWIWIDCGRSVDQLGRQVCVLYIKF